MLSRLLEAVHVTMDKSAESTSDFSMVSSPRKPQTTELSTTQDVGMHDSDHYSCAAVFSLYVTDCFAKCAYQSTIVAVSLPCCISPEGQT